MSGLPGAVPSGVRGLAGRLAAVGLLGPASEGPVEVPPKLWPSLLSYLTHQRITGLASAAAGAGAVVLTDTQRDELADRHRSALGVVVMVERLLCRVSEAFGAEGLSSVVLKGPAVAHTFYPDPSWRLYGDLDLLVPANDFRRACAVLAGLGFRRLLPEPRPGFDERFGKGATHEDTEGRQVDLHRTLALGPFGVWMNPSEVFEGTTELRINGMSLRRLDDTLALLHACVHASLGRKDPLVSPLRDVLQIAWSGRVDWDLTARRARRWRIAAPVSHALRTASATLAVELPEEASHVLAIPVRPFERKALAAYTTDRVRSGAVTLAMVRAIPGIGAKAAYLHALVLPEKQFLAARAAEGSRGSYRNRWMVPLGWAGRRLRSAMRPKRR